jgi:hypothetical protein
MGSYDSIKNVDCNAAQGIEDTILKVRQIDNKLYAFMPDADNLCTPNDSWSWVEITDNMTYNPPTLEDAAYTTVCIMTDSDDGFYDLAPTESIIWEIERFDLSTP